VQLSSSGTAVFNFYPGPGTHTYQAQFLGTHVEAASSSSGTPLVVTPFYPTTTTIAASGNPGSYTLTATVTGTEGTVPPTGTISFQDTSNANYVLATAPLIGNPAAPGFNSVGVSDSSVGSGPFLYDVADFNGDGRLDLAIADYGSDKVTVSLGNGDGTFMSGPITSLPPNTGGYATTGDFNGDGKLDFAVLSEIPSGPYVDGNEVNILLGNGDGSFVLGQQIQGFPVFITSGDFNGDGIADLALSFEGIGGVTANGKVAILLGNGDGTFTTLASTAPTGASPQYSAAGDFNGDGKTDLAVVNFSSNSVTILLGNGDGTFTPTSQALATGAIPVSVVVADLNGDGNLDLAVLTSGNVPTGHELPSTVTILLGNGDGTFTPAAVSPVLSSVVGSIVESVAESMAVGDFNGDGKADLAITTIRTGIVGIEPITMQVLLGNGDGTFAPKLSLPTGYYGNPTKVATGDFNGDGLSDIAVDADESDSVYLLLSQAGPQSATAAVSGVSVVGTGTHLVDASYPGDGGYQSSVSGTVGLTAEPVPTTLTLTGTPSSVMLGQQAVLTATVAPGVAQNHTPTGTVTFKLGSTVLGTTTVTTGVATLNRTSLPTGTDSLTAVYSGDTNFAGSTASATEVVAGIASATVLTAAPNPAGTGQTVTLTAAVTGAGVTPTGTVMFYDGAAQIGQGTLDATGHAAFSTAGLAVGTHSLTALYAGDATYVTSTSAAVVETIETPGFTIALSSPSVTLATHGVGSATVTLASLGSFADTLVLSCANAPADLSCSFKPNPAALTANGTASVALSLNTNALIAEGRRTERPGPGAEGRSGLALLLGPVGLLVAFGRRRRWRLRVVLVAVTAVPLMVGLSSCGSVVTAVPSTGPGVYTIPVMATGSVSGLVRSAQLTLTVTK
jgi:hypothetical protein